MREEMRAHRLVLIFIAGWIAIFLYMLFASGAHRNEAKVEAEAMILLTNLVAAAFVYVGMGEIWQLRRSRRVIDITFANLRRKRTGTLRKCDDRPSSRS